MLTEPLLRNGGFFIRLLRSNGCTCCSFRGLCPATGLYVNATILWNVTRYSPVDSHRSIRGKYRFHLQGSRLSRTWNRLFLHREESQGRPLDQLSYPDDVDSAFLRNVVNDLPDSTASQTEWTWTLARLFPIESSTEWLKETLHAFSHDCSFKMTVLQTTLPQAFIPTSWCCLLLVCTVLTKILRPIYDNGKSGTGLWWNWHCSSSAGSVVSLLRASDCLNT
jgi:hypothetical protein